MFKAPRTLPDIQKEYESTLPIAGELQYKIDLLKRELETVNKSIDNLNLEAAEANKIAAAAKKAESTNETPSVPGLSV